MIQENKQKNHKTLKVENLQEVRFNDFHFHVEEWAKSPADIAVIRHHTVHSLVWKLRHNKDE